MEDDESMGNGAVQTLDSPASDSGESKFFDLKPPAASGSSAKIEDLMSRLYAPEHLHLILADHGLFLKFSTFLNRFRPNLVPTLIRYLEMKKAMKAIAYGNSLARKIRWPSRTDYSLFSRLGASIIDTRFEDYAQRELDLLCSEALQAFTTHCLVDYVVDCVQKDITGQPVPAMQALVGQLAEVFCMTDPSLPDNPIIYASEEFHRTTQYGTTYAIDRNCRFLQGPGTNKHITHRIAQALARGQECCEVLMNYRRDGTPFANLLMCAPLYDDKGIVRYFIGAQVDVTGLIEDGRGIESFRTLLVQEEEKSLADDKSEERNSTEYGESRNTWLASKTRESLSALQELSTMFSQEESDVVNKHSRSSDSFNDAASIISTVPTSVKNRGQARRIIGAGETEDTIGAIPLQMPSSHSNGASSNLPGVYRHYLLVRPYPSLKIIFVSPSLRLPGILRTHLFSKIGGPPTTISSLEEAFQDGASVTAKVLWLPRSPASTQRGFGGTTEAKPRWIRCTPLLGSDDRVGVWMIVLVAVETEDAPYGGNGRGLGYENSMRMVGDEMEEWRRLAMGNHGAASRIGGGGVAGSKASSRSCAGSRNVSESGGDLDGGFGLRRRGDRERILEVRKREKTRGIGHDELYAEYLREQGERRGSSAADNGEEKMNRSAHKNGLVMTNGFGSPARIRTASGGGRLKQKAKGAEHEELYAEYLREQGEKRDSGATEHEQQQIFGNNNRDVHDQEIRITNALKSPTRIGLANGAERPYVSSTNGGGTPNGSVRRLYINAKEHLARPHKVTIEDEEVSPNNVHGVVME